MKIKFGKKCVLSLIILIFSIIGFLSAAEALKIHNGKSDSGICEVGGAFDCDIVNQSVYSEVFGVPFALLGMIGYAAMVIALIAYRVNKKKEYTEWILAALVAMATIGLGIQVYLTIIEAFVLRAWCLLCLVSQVSIVTVTVAAWILRTNELKQT